MRISEKRFWSAQSLFSRSRRKLEQVYRTLNGIILQGTFCDVDLEKATNRTVVKIRSDVVAYFAPRWGVGKKIFHCTRLTTSAKPGSCLLRIWGRFITIRRLNGRRQRLVGFHENIWFSSVASRHVSIWKETILGDVKMICSMDWYKYKHRWNLRGLEGWQPMFRPHMNEDGVSDWFRDISN
jgi:hypothetical protein